eukprot:SM000020S06011  [mRNA]  locus=s20:443207:447129:+ [translate_table: standard]
MVGSGSLAEDVARWLTAEMHCRPPTLSPEDVAPLCRGNMQAVWRFLTQRVRSEQTVQHVRKNLVVHGRPAATTAAALSPAVHCATGPTREVAAAEVRALRGQVADAESQLRQAMSLLLQEDVCRRDNLAETNRIKSGLALAAALLPDLCLCLSRMPASCSPTSASTKAHIPHHRSEALLLEAFQSRCRLLFHVLSEYLDGLATNLRAAAGCTADKSEQEEALLYCLPAPALGAGPAERCETASQTAVREACEASARAIFDHLREAYPDNESADGAAACGRGVQVDELFHLGGLEERLAAMRMEPRALLEALAWDAAGAAAQLQKAANNSANIQQYDDSLSHGSPMYAPSHTLAWVGGSSSSLCEIRPAACASRAAAECEQRVTKSTKELLQERQRAHVQQFMEAEGARNEAAEAQATLDRVVKELEESTATAGCQPGEGVTLVDSASVLQVQVWELERKIASSKAAADCLAKELASLIQLRRERKEAQDIAAAAGWPKYVEDMAIASEHDHKSIFQQVGIQADLMRGLIENEAVAFTAYVKRNGPKPEEALLEPLLGEVKARFPCCSAQRIVPHTEAALRERESLQDIVTQGWEANAASRTSSGRLHREAAQCIRAIAEQEKEMEERWLPKMEAAMGMATSAQEKGQIVHAMVDDWWNQPAATVVDWVKVDGKDVCTWLNDIKQCCERLR